MTDAAQEGAVCLDGSPGGFYLRQQPSSTKWLVFHQGGGWCTSSLDCLKRAGTTLGSSTQWPATYTDLYEGSELFETPPFNEFNVVYAMYCDGGSWAGNAVDEVNGTAVYYRGRLLLDALLDELLGLGMEQAKEVLYAGCSAGGLTAYMHTDYVRSRLPSSVHMLGLADAMYSLVHADVRGDMVFPERMQWVAKAMNVSGSSNDKCEAALSSWECLFGSNVVNYVQTPMLVLNSKYDTWQQAAILGLNCTIGKCLPHDEDFWVSYGRTMLAKLTTLPPHHAVFLTNCPAHCQTGTGGDWTKRSVKETTIATAVSTWYNDTIALLSGDGQVQAAPRWIENCDTVPCGKDVC